MNHPYGRCEDCGERLYARLEGGYWCPNCGSRYRDDFSDDDPDEDGESGRRVPA